jgi:predicted ester cyclase
MSNRGGGVLVTRPLRPYSDSVADAERIRQNITDAFGAFMTDGRYELAERLYHPDYVNHEAADERSRGPRGAVETAKWLRSCFGEAAYEIERVIVEGDMAAVYLTMSGTHEGGLPPGAPATHQPFAVKHVHLVRFAEDGRALEHWAVRDDLGLAMQAGLLPSAS